MDNFHPLNMNWLQDSAARIAHQQAKREEAMGTKDFYNLETGYITYFRIAPPWSADGAFGRGIGRHYQVPGSRAGKKGDICLGNWPHLPAECPLCSVYGRLYEENPKKSPPREEAYLCRRKEYFYVNAFVVGRSARVNQGTEDSPQWVDGQFEPMVEDPTRCRIIRLSPKSFSWFVTQGWNLQADITHPTEGVLCMVAMSGVNKQTRYIESLAGTNSIHGFQPVRSRLFETDEQINEAMGTINDLDKIWKLPDDTVVHEINQLAFQVNSRYGQQVGVPTPAGAMTLPGATTMPPAATAAPAVQVPGMAPPPDQPPAPGTTAPPEPPAPPDVPTGTPAPAVEPATASAPPPVSGAAAPMTVLAPPHPVSPPPSSTAGQAQTPPAGDTAPASTPPQAPAPAGALQLPTPPMAPATSLGPNQVAPPAPPPGPEPTPPGPPSPATIAPPPPPAPASASAAPVAPGMPPVAPGAAPAASSAPASVTPPSGRPEGSPECYGQHHLKKNHQDPVVRAECQACEWENVCEVSPENMALKSKPV